jgi:hypothetical protein
MRWNLFRKRRSPKAVRASRPAVRPRLEALKAREVSTAYALAFNLNSSLSTLTVSGNVSISGFNPSITTQGPGSLTTHYSGALNTLYDPGASTLQFVAAGSALTAANSGNWAPLSGGASGTAPANYGGHISVTVIVQVESADVAVRGLVGNVSTSSPLALGGGTSIPSTETLNITSGVADYRATGAYSATGSSSIVTSASNSGAAGTFSNLGSGNFHIRVPVSVTTTLPVGSGTATLHINGTLEGDASYCTAKVVGSTLTATNTGPAAVLTLGHSGSTTTICGASFADSSFSSDVINTGGENDTVNLETTLAGKPVTVNEGAGNDTVNLSPAAHSLGNIQGNVTVNGGSGANTLQAFDQADPAADTYTLNNGSLTRSGSAAVSYTNTTTLNLSGGSGNAIYNIERNGSGVTTVTAGAGNNAFNLSPTAQLLDNLQGTLNLNGGAGTNTLNVNDQNDPNADTYALSSSSLTRTGSGVVNYSGLAALNLAGGFGGVTYNIGSTALGTSYSVVGGAGDDLFYVGAGDLSTIQGALSVDGGSGGNDTVILDDGSNLDTYTTSTPGSVAVGRLPGFVFNYANIVSLVVFTDPSSTFI